MNINQITATANSTGQLPSTAQTGKKSDRDMFMTLLVEQLKNQDPLEPQDGAAFVAQLAQFNSLDQLIGIRDSIAQLTTLLQQNNASKSDAGAAVLSQLKNFAGQIKSV